MKHAAKFGALFAAMTAVGFAGAAVADESSQVIHGGTIGYVLTDYHWAMYQTKDGKAECPQGFNDGPREQFKILFPEDGKKRTLLETQLSRESAIWHPDLKPEPYAFKEAQGKIGFGMNLDGKVGPNDFTSPDGSEKGIDNQLYRVLGCVSNYRGPDGTLYHFNNKFMQQHEYARVLIELTGVDSLVNDNDVTLTTYRGRDGLLTDATGNSFMPGGTQRADHKWGKEFISRFKGKIVDGVLTVQAAEYHQPTTWAFEDVTDQWFKDPRFQLKINQDRAEGLLAGYVDIETFYLQMARAVSTHHQSYGQQSSPSVYRALHKLADAYPDKDGHNTAISFAADVKFVQAFIEHPAAETAAKEAETPVRAAHH